MKFDSWRVKCSDFYNFDAGKSAFVQLFGVIEDEELDELRKVGLAVNFAVSSQELDGLRMTGAQPFSVSLGN